MLFDFARGTIQRRGTARDFRVLDSARERNKTGKFLEKTEDPRVKKETERKRKRQKERKEREREEKGKRKYG